MKKNVLFTFSVLIAIVIFIAVKKDENKIIVKDKSYKTFVKNQNRSIASYPTTHDEFKTAMIDNKKTEVLDKQSKEKEKLLLTNYKLRDNRILIGDNAEKYASSFEKLPMINSQNPNWKTLLGNDLLRFQREDTKVIIKEELPIIKVIDGKGQYLEQVIITYLLKNGDRNSYRALVDSESGLVLETWDRTIHEKYKIKRKSASLDAVPLQLAE
jgi:hypothetical protein